MPSLNPCLLNYLLIRDPILGKYYNLRKKVTIQLVKIHFYLCYCYYRIQKVPSLPASASKTTMKKTFNFVRWLWGLISPSKNCESE